MTTSQQAAMKQALEALYDSVSDNKDWIEKRERAITALRQALEVEQPEPVAYRHLHEDGWEYYDAPTGEDCNDCEALYNHALRTLSDEEIKKLIVPGDYLTAGGLLKFARSVLAKAGGAA